MAMERTNAGDNRFVNNKDFGKIAQSSRGSNSSTQVGNDNQREGYNANRGKAGTGSKATKADAIKSYSPKTPIPLQGVRAKERAQQRAGGSGK